MGPAGVRVSNGTRTARQWVQLQMVINDPVGDMVTRIRNAVMARHDKLTLPASNLKTQIANVLKSEGFIADVVVHEKKPQNEITLMLKYGQGRMPAIQGIKRESKPGLRRYVHVREIPRVRGGTGVAILSTSKGILADHDARKQSVGGELLCTVY